MFHKIIFILVLFQSVCLIAQTDSLYVEVDTLEVKTSSGLHHTKSLEPFFKKLDQLSNSSTQKVSIVHIGDSHIQADIFSGRMRKLFQNTFGHAGRGLVFPHNLAKSNGASDIR
ncbi:MAG: peptidoglycan-binding protein, partial [Flavobacterium sp.]